MKSMLAFIREWQVSILILIFTLAIGGLTGWVVRDQLARPTFRSVREQSPEFKLIAPFLYLEVPESTLPEYRALKSVLEERVGKMLAERRVEDMSVYVRNMNTGQWSAVHETHTFALASMLKVVTVMTVLHEAERRPDTLAGTITIAPGATDTVEKQAYAPPENPVEFGVPYTLEQLFWHDIVESDNVAERALEAYIGTDTIKQTYADLRLPVPPTHTTDSATAQEYSHLFRVLYGATYLSRENSQALLDLLSRTKFTKGLVAGVPPGTTVAHKFGENYVPSSDKPGAPVWHELHDCGIVYYPDHPYFICVTTKGDDFDTLANVIREISALTWEEMKKIHTD